MHGLYTTAGFWLSYFNLFRDFRLIVYDINYDLLLKAPNAKCYLHEHLNKDKYSEDIVAIISHSLGTVVSDLVFENEQSAVFKVCPVAHSKRIDTQRFILEIENKTSLIKESILEYMNLVRDFTSKVKQQLNYNGSIYIYRTMMVSSHTKFRNVKKMNLKEIISI